MRWRLKPPRIYLRNQSPETVSYSHAGIGIDAGSARLAFVVRKGSQHTRNVAALQASAEPIGCPLRTLSFRIAAQVEHKWLPE